MQISTAQGNLKAVLDKLTQGSMSVRQTSQIVTKDRGKNGNVWQPQSGEEEKKYTEKLFLWKRDVGADSGWGRECRQSFQK